MKLAFIGMGNMAYAIYHGIINSHYLEPDDIIAYDINTQQYSKLDKNTVQAKSIEEVLKADLIIVAVKPQVLESVLIPLKDGLKNKAVVSIALGYLSEQYNKLLDESTRHLSVMPNTPALVGCGMTLFEKNHSLTEEEYAFAKGLFTSFGQVEEIPTHLMNAAGSLTGCGPAFIYMVIEALADGAVKEGVPRNQAYTLASTMIMGSAKMQLETKQHPGILKDNVCSPGGSTIRGVTALEEGQLRALFNNALSACVHYKD